jgi:hypothetical protein
MHHTDSPPPHATHACSLFEARFAATSARTIALIQIRNGLKALRPGVACPVSTEAVLDNIDANLRIVEQALAGVLAGGLGAGRA